VVAAELERVSADQAGEILDRVQACAKRAMPEDVRQEIESVLPADWREAFVGA